MGALSAIAMAEASITLEQQISWHLTVNHYPPIPEYMVEPCIEAIDLVNEGNWTEKVYLPEGVTWRGLIAAPAGVIVEQYHLEPWIIERELD